MNTVTTTGLAAMKQRGEKICMLTCYHAMQARLLDAAGIDVILVGDSLNMVLLGNPNTLSATLDQMIMFTAAVRRGTTRPLLVGDMPFLSYGVGIEDSVRGAGRFLAEAGAGAVKVEGGERIVPTVEALVRNNIPVMGHIGLTPQALHRMGGFKVQGKGSADAARIKQDALLLQKAGAFALVLECIPAELAREITASCTIPTIGIGAGPGCDGQVLVIDDILGMAPSRRLTFVKQYLDLGEQIPAAVRVYIDDVRKGRFPDSEHSF